MKSGQKKKINKLRINNNFEVNVNMQQIFHIWDTYEHHNYPTNYAGNLPNLQGTVIIGTSNKC